MQSTGNRRKPLQVASFFSGIGGFELGLARSGHRVLCFCDNDPASRRVLSHRFAGVPILDDIRTVDTLPSGTDLVTAGFPCQDLSPAGRTAGIFGEKSGLVWEVFRLIDRDQPNWLLLENVPFMLRLGRGLAMERIVSALEERGYRWAYRVLDPRTFGIPQRRPRVFIVASQLEVPWDVLFGNDASAKRRISPEIGDSRSSSYGFYWTEGNRGIGWAVDSVPALKGGSSLGIPSAPAIILEDRRVVTPHLADAERLQGFPPHWTSAAAISGRVGDRWRLIGNAVNARVAAWIGAQLAAPSRFEDKEKRLLSSSPWPASAYGDGTSRFYGPEIDITDDTAGTPIHQFLRFPPRLLSHKAASGVLGRLKRSSLKLSPVLLRALEGHVSAMAA